MYFCVVETLLLHSDISPTFIWPIKHFYIKQQTTISHLFIGLLSPPFHVCQCSLQQITATEVGCWFTKLSSAAFDYNSKLPILAAAPPPFTCRLHVIHPKVFTNIVRTSYQFSPSGVWVLQFVWFQSFQQRLTGILQQHSDMTMVTTVVLTLTTLIMMMMISVTVFHPKDNDNIFR